MLRRKGGIAVFSDNEFSIAIVDDLDGGRTQIQEMVSRLLTDADIPRHIS